MRVYVVFPIFAPQIKTFYMNIEQIIALLATKFPGVRKDVLTALAGSIALQAESEDEVNAIVGKIAAEKVTKYGQDYRSAIDREIQQSVQTAESNLRNKFNFVEKKPKDQEPKPIEPGGGALTLENIKQLFAQQVQPLQEELKALKADKLANTRKEQFQALFKGKNLPDDMVKLMTEQFDRMSFQDDEAFNAYLAGTQPTIEKLAQSRIDDTLTGGVPKFGNKVDKDGVSAEVTAFRQAKSNPQNDLGGKTV